MQTVTAAQVAEKAAKDHAGQIDQIARSDADLQGDVMKDDLTVGIIGADIKHVRIPEGVRGYVD